ncbi:MAG TPA: hypothetical protein V6D17_02290 [Candidatus Obscuribacterales bacterium]
MNKPGDSMLIGEMLRRAKLIKLEDMTNALQVSAKTGLPIGRVLVMLGLIRNETLTTAITAQSLVRDRLIHLDTAVKAVELAHHYRLSLTEALERLGCLDDLNDSTNKLGELLITAGHISRRQVDEALKASQHLGLPLGRILVLKGFLKGGLVQAALAVQAMIRDGDITYDDGIDALRTISGPEWSLDQSFAALGLQKPARPHLRLGELLQLAKLVSEADMLTALEVSLSTDLELGEALVRAGFISEGLLEAAMGLQEMIACEHLTAEEAAEALRTMGRKGCSLTESMTEIHKSEIKGANLIGLMDLLKLAGLLSDEALKRAIASDPRKVKPFDEVLIKTGLITEATLHIAMKCQSMIDAEELTYEQAIIALHHWQWSGATLAEIIDKFGWKAKAKRQIQKTIHDLPITQLAVAAAKNGTWEQKKKQAVS